MNINPESYLAPTTARSNPRPVSYEGRLERPVQYLVRVDLSRLNPIDQSKFDEIQNEVLADGNVRIDQHGMRYTLIRARRFTGWNG